MTIRRTKQLPERADDKVFSCLLFVCPLPGISEGVEGFWIFSKLSPSDEPTISVSGSKRPLHLSPHPAIVWNADATLAVCILHALRSCSDNVEFLAALLQSSGSNSFDESALKSLQMIAAGLCIGVMEHTWRQCEGSLPLPRRFIRCSDPRQRFKKRHGLYSRDCPSPPPPSCPAPPNADELTHIAGTATRMVSSTGRAIIGLEEAQLACDFHIRARPSQREVCYGQSSTLTRHTSLGS